MILLDTNVVSEAMRPVPDPRVLHWLNESDSGLLYLSVITIAEISYGLRVMPTGNRRDALAVQFDAFVRNAFGQRVLSFDEKAATSYGDIMGYRKEIGRPMSVLDGQIAAIARTRNFTVATRNVSDFSACGLEIVDPWQH